MNTTPQHLCPKCGHVCNVLPPATCACHEVHVSDFNGEQLVKLKHFEPLDGKWECVSNNKTVGGIESEIASLMEKYAGYPVTVRVFHTNGHAITGDCPTEGDFLITRD